MVSISKTKERHPAFYADFLWEDDERIGRCFPEIKQVFSGKYLETFVLPGKDHMVLLVGCGKQEEVGLFQVKELFAAAAAKCKDLGIQKCSLGSAAFLERLGERAVTQAVLGLGLGGYEYEYRKTGEKKTWDCEFLLEETEETPISREALEEGEELLNGTLFARNMVNTPGNRLRPLDFAHAVAEFEKDADIELQILEYDQLRQMKMEALCGVGGSSEYLPCMVVLRYKGDPDSTENYGLAGKGITCDTGGYCLKGAGSMGGIKSDMAGAAAVAAAVHTAARLRLKVNITACLPMSENRISRASMLPGDVITGYGGKTIEILNTDAEGRLILCDAAAYLVKDEGVTHVLDIATLTGAVAQMLGNTIAGAMSDNDEFYGILESAALRSGERYLRIPYGKEHENMIKSQVADLKNIGADHCGTITAGLFIREFCGGKPWIHLDIAGTAWCGAPTFAFEKAGATGAGVGTIYYLMKEAGCCGQR